MVFRATPLKNDGVSNSWDGLTFPIYGNITFMFQTTNQMCVYIYTYTYHNGCSIARFDYPRVYTFEPFQCGCFRPIRLQKLLCKMNQWPIKWSAISERQKKWIVHHCTLSLAQKSPDQLQSACHLSQRTGLFGLFGWKPADKVQRCSKKKLRIEHRNQYQSILKWQCVKTNSTPSVHIKIAGIYGCSSP